MISSFFFERFMVSLRLRNMKISFRLLPMLCAACFALCAAAARADEWLPNFEDIPKMEKTYVVEDDGFVYSQPDGKIVQTTVASDEVSRRQLQRFYRDALDELGWKNSEDSRSMQVFVRGAEELKIEILTTEPLSAKFTLSPK
jgi:hypothetical protein